MDKLKNKILSFFRSGQHLSLLKDNTIEEAILLKTMMSLFDSNIASYLDAFPIGYSSYILLRFDYSNNKIYFKRIPGLYNKEHMTVRKFFKEILDD